MKLGYQRRRIHIEITTSLLLAAVPALPPSIKPGLPKGYARTRPRRIVQAGSLDFLEGEVTAP